MTMKIEADETRNRVALCCARRGRLRVTWVTPAVCRIQYAREGPFSTAALNRYGFIREQRSPVKFTVTEQADAVAIASDALTLRVDAESLRLALLDPSGARLVEESREARGSVAEGFAATFSLSKDVHFFGLGDQTRERIEHRGTRCRLWIENVERYVPIPLLLTDAGYALLVNTTRKVFFDLGADSDAAFGFEGSGATLDYYLIGGASLAQQIEAYTDLSGRPPMPPKWTFGLWFVSHMHVNAHEMLQDCLSFRREGIPCDAIGLEPGWMSENYDFSTGKKWHPERFHMPGHVSPEQPNFLHAARHLGFKPGLWLCNDYDLSFEEERRLRRVREQEGAAPDDQRAADSRGRGDLALEQDEHLQQARRLDALTKPQEAWYEHLEKFVDRGVLYFKMDGANQVLDHPDRLYGNGMTDDEMHNLYPLLYSRQMYEGFRRQTNRRPAIYTPAGWVGVQCFPGTWTGDTGGGVKPLVGCLNLGLSGHTYATCDMDDTRVEGIHFGFLLPWAQLCSWAYWKHPWFLPAELKACFRDYARLRYRLIPYLYSQAWQSHCTGMPLIRALPLAFPGDLRALNVLNAYLLGADLLVTAYDPEIYLPAGEWTDYWTGETHQGPKAFTYTPPPRRGGGLFVRAGAILPLQADMNYVGEEPETRITLEVFASDTNADADGACVLYEDDGITFDYEGGAFATTEIGLRRGEKGFALEIGERSNGYEGMPERCYVMKVHLQKPPQRVALGRKALRKETFADGTLPALRGWAYDRASNCLWVNTAAAAGVVTIV